MDKQSDLPWSIQYPIGTNAHYHQLLNGLIDENATYSLGLHPVQIYEAILLFTIAFIVWKAQKFWKKTWSTLIFSLILFFIFRFSIEFLRDPASSNFDIKTILGISLIQWFLLITGIVCSIMLFMYEKSSVTISQNISNAEPSLRNSIIYILSVSAVIYVFRSLFTPFELLSLNIKFIPAILLTAYYVFSSMKTARIKVAITSLFVLPLFLITQTFSSDSTKSVLVKNINDEVKSYKRIDLNTSIGDFYNTLSYNPHEGQCGTAYTHEDYEYLYRMAGSGFSLHQNRRKINIYNGDQSLWRYK